MELASVILVWLAYLLYAAAFAVFLIGFFTQRLWMNRLGLIVAAAGLVAQTLGIILRGVEAGRFPFVGLYESLVLVAWAVVLVWHVLESFTKIKAVGLYVMPVVLVLLTLALISVRPAAGHGPGAAQRHRRRPRDRDARRHRLPLRGRRRGDHLPHRGAAAAPPQDRRRARPPAVARGARPAHLPRHAARPAVPHHGHGRRRDPRRDVQGARLGDRPHGAAVRRRLARLPACSSPAACAATGRAAPSRGSPSAASSCSSSSGSPPCRI